MLTFDIPLNSLSLSQSIFPVIKELYRRNIPCLIHPIGGQVDLSAYNIDEKFGAYINKSLSNFDLKHKRGFPTARVWHIRGSLESVSRDQTLLTFFEMDSLTDTEVNILSNQRRVLTTSKFTQKVFQEYGIESTYLPLYFDSETFYKKDTVYLPEDVCVFQLTGKWELRKQTEKIINLWAKKFANDRKYRLNLLVSNPFLKPEIEQQLFQRAVGKPCYNITWLPRLKTNAEINDTINCCFSELAGLSASEAWNWPLFNALAMEKQCPVLAGHVHNDYANEENSILVKPTHKIKGEDGVFFGPGNYNIGNWDNTSDEAIVASFEEVVKRFPNQNVNGAKLKEEYTVAKTTDILLENV